MNTVLLIHLIFIGVWLGCVLTEALFERALLGKGHDSERILANLHVKVDLFIEIPATTIVILTGTYMIAAYTLSTLILFKVALAIVAIAANLYCGKLIFARRAYALAGDWERFSKVDHLQHKVGAIVLVGILGAIILGAIA